MEHGKESVMEVIAPLGVDAVASGLTRSDDSRIVEIALGDQDEATPESSGEYCHLRRQLLQKVNGGAVDERVDGIEAQAIDVIVAHPHERVVAEKPAHLIAARILKIDRVTPWGAVVVSKIKIGTELAGIITDRPEVVVDHIEQHCQTAQMGGIDESLQPVRTA